MLKPREIRVELVIATLALCASAAASIATVVQTSVVGNQLSASVWPYLTVANTYTPGSLGVGLENDGLGPALVRNITLTVDGKPATSWSRALKLLVLTKSIKQARVRIEESDVGPGSVIRPGASQSLIHVQSPLLVTGFPLARSLGRRVDLSVCYCSILQQCWTVTGSRAGPPQSVHDCGPPGPPLTY